MANARHYKRLDTPEDIARRKAKTAHLEKYKLSNRSEESKKAIQAKGGSTKTVKTMAASLQNSGVLKDKLTDDQRKIMRLIASGDYTATIQNMLLLIAGKAESADDWNKLLTQLLKLPFIEKIYQDAMKEKRRDVIPIVVDFLLTHNQDHLVGELYDRLRREGWDMGDGPKRSPLGAIKEAEEVLNADDKSL